MKNIPYKRMFIVKLHALIKNIKKLKIKPFFPLYNLFYAFLKM